ncbi:MAG: ABC transporter permease [Gammaproteobacteria bacterium]|nr:ABC transporter permease [Gammaproteobacteria bacterium]
MFLLAFRSIFRHKVRTGLTLAAIIFGVGSLVLIGGFVEDIFIQLQEATVHSQLGHIQVYRSGYTKLGRRNPYGYLIDKPEQILESAADLPQVSDQLLRVKFAGLANNGRADLPVIGEAVQPDKEARLGSAMTITSGRQLTGNDPHGILVGQGVADALQLEPGDYLTLLVNTTDGVLNSHEFEVIGIFRTFARDYDNRAVRISLVSGQDLIGTSGVHSVVLSLDTTEATDSVARALQQQLTPQDYEVRTWYELSDFYGKTVNLYRRQFTVLQLIILLMVLLTVANSVNMAIYERIGEFGTLKALGDRQRDIFRQVMKENMLLGLLGAGLGVAIGVALAWAISGVGIDMPPPPNSDVGYTAYIRLVPGVIAMAFGVGVIATVCAALLPAWRVSRLPVAEALRENV